MLESTIQTIRPLDGQAMEACQRRLDNLTKPLGSLDGLEKIAVRLAGITGKPRPNALKKSIVLMAADHGVAAEAVSAYPQEVTPQMVVNFCQGGAAINIFARHAAAELVLIDVGVAVDLPNLPGLIREKIAYGSRNIAIGPAMNALEAQKAIAVGIMAAQNELAKGVGVIGLGEMGIANTTPSTAIVASYSPCPVRELTGQGTGVAGAALENKARIIERALKINQPCPADPLDVLSKVGGLEIAALVGVILGAAAGGAAVILDGVITGAAALIATRMAPASREYLFGSHFSSEPAHKEALRIMRVPAYLHLGMRLGEGTGAALGMRLIDAALHMLNDMKTFGEAEVAVAQDGPGATRQTGTI